MAHTMLWPSTSRCDEPASDSKPSTAKSLADLDPDTRKRYEEARERLRQAEREQEQAARDADAADPLLAQARETVAKACKLAAEAHGPLQTLTSQYAERGAAELKAFNEWQRGYNHQAGLAYFKRLAADPAQHALIVQFTEQHIKQRASNSDAIRPELRALLPDNLADLKGEEFLETMLEIGEAEAALNDVAALEKTVAPTDEAKETVARMAEARTSMSIYGPYVAMKTAVAQNSAKRKCMTIRNEVTTIWPNWAAAEREAAR